MFGIGGSEILIIAVVVLLLFGPDKIPEVARTVGRFMREFKRYQAMMESTFKAEMYLSEQNEMTKKAESAPSDPFKKAREYREKQGIVLPGENPIEPTAADAVGDADDDAPIAPEDAGWVPGSPGAPGMGPVDDGKEEGEQQ